MEYLDKVLGIEVTYENAEFNHLPNFIVTRYRLQMTSLNGEKVIFLYPKTELEQIEHLHQLKEKGILTEKEFQEKKKQLLSQL